MNHAEGGTGTGISRMRASVRTWVPPAISLGHCAQILHTLFDPVTIATDSLVHHFSFAYSGRVMAAFPNLARDPIPFSQECSTVGLKGAVGLLSIRDRIVNTRSHGSMEHECPHTDHTLGQGHYSTVPVSHKCGHTEVYLRDYGRSLLLEGGVRFQTSK